jgi:Ca2+-transporting ATPase
MKPVPLSFPTMSHGKKLFLSFQDAKLAFADCFNLQVFNEFNARKPDEINVFKGVTKNHLFMGIVGFTVILQVSSHYFSFGLSLAVYWELTVPLLIALQIILIEFTGDFTTTVRLNWKQWLICVAIGIVRLVKLPVFIG